METNREHELSQMCANEVVRSAKIARERDALRAQNEALVAALLHIQNGMLDQKGCIEVARAALSAARK